MQTKIAYLLEAICSQFYTHSNQLLFYSTVTALFTNRMQKDNQCRPMLLTFSGDSLPILYSFQYAALL